MKDRALGFTREVLIADDFPHIVLRQDNSRRDLIIFNRSDTDVVYIATGVTDYPELLQSGKYPQEIAIPLYPGEAWEPEIIPYNDIVLFLDSESSNVTVTVAYATLLPDLVRGEARPNG